MSKTFRLEPFQDRYIFSESKFPAMVSAWGTGKTMSLITRAMVHSTNYPNNLGVIFRKEFTDLRDSTIKDFELYTGMKVDSTREARLPNGSIIMFRHMEEIQNLQNINLGFFGIEQAEELESDEQFFMLFGRLRRAGVPHWGSVIANTRGHNWVWRLWKKGELSDAELIEATTFDNQKNLPEDFFGTLSEMKKQKPKRYACFVLNSWDEVVGQFFDTWDNKLHVVKPRLIDKEWTIYQSLDWGYKNPLACYWWAVSPDQKKVYCIREYYVTGKRSDEAAREIHAISQEMFGKDYISKRAIREMYVDPSIFADKGHGGKTIAEDFQEVMREDVDGRWSELLILGADNDRVQGWNVFRSMLAIQDDGEPMCQWFEGCQHAIETLPIQQHDENRGEDMDSDGEDHAADSCRYFFISRFLPKKVEPEKPWEKLKDLNSRREWELVAASRKKSTGGFMKQMMQLG